MKIAAYLLAAGALAFSAPALASDWTFLARGTSCSYDGLVGSLELRNTRGGEAVAVVIVRATCTGKAPEINRRYVTLSECQRGRGKLVTLDMEGNYRYENDFVRGGDTVASGLADAVCDAAASDAEERARRSI